MVSVRRAAELTVMAETMRDVLLRRGWPPSGAEVAELCRLEGAADRALRRLGLPAASGDVKDTTAPQP